MLRALFERNIVPDLIVGSSVGALNGAFVAAEPSLASVDRMIKVWTSLSERGVFGGSVFGQIGTLARHGTHLHSNDGLRQLIEDELGPLEFDELAVRFECVAASIERASATWFSTGLVTPAVLASCAVPGLLPAVEIGGEHYFDGGLVRSVPIGRCSRIGRQAYLRTAGGPPGAAVAATDATMAGRGGRIRDRPAPSVRGRARRPPRSGGRQCPSHRFGAAGPLDALSLHLRRQGSDRCCPRGDGRLSRGKVLSVANPAPCPPFFRGPCADCSCP